MVLTKRREMNTTVYGADATLFRMAEAVSGRRDPSSSERFRERMREVIRRNREASERRQMIEHAITLEANYRQPSHPTRGFVGGRIVSGRGDVADAIHGLVVDAVATELHRRGLGALESTYLADELVEQARSALVGREPEFEAESFEEAARAAVDRLLESGRHRDVLERPEGAIL